MKDPKARDPVWYLTFVPSMYLQLAWEKLKASFSEQTQKVFEESIKSDISNAELATKFAISESSVRVFKMRVRKAMHKEIIRLNSELET